MDIVSTSTYCTLTCLAHVIRAVFRNFCIERKPFSINTRVLVQACIHDASTTETRPTAWEHHFLSDVSCHGSAVLLLCWRCAEQSTDWLNSDTIPRA